MAERRGLRVLKFGGTSLETPSRVEAIVRVIGERAGAGPTVVVVSAFGGVTDALLVAARAAAARDGSYVDLHRAIGERHRRAVDMLVSQAERTAVAETVEAGVADLHDLLRGVFLVRECSPRTLDSILSYGERLSAAIVAAALRRAGIAAEMCDARPLIVTDATFGNARVDAEAAHVRLRRQLTRSGCLQVVTGFIGSTLQGETTTLGRGGSDYTAALVGAALDAEAVEIWTDVDGVMSADPRLVPNAFSVPALSYLELLELSHFGAKVVHPPTVHPARERSIPLLIRNTLNPAFPGTRVEERPPLQDAHPVRGISSIPLVALLRLEGDAMAGTPGIVQRLFGALAAERIPVILITQASSGHSLCLALEPSHLERARARIEAEFGLERRAGLLDDLVVEPECSVIAAVGEGMRETPGISGRVFGVLGREGVNVRAIAQGSSELNISLAVAARDHARALRAIHDAFFFPGTKNALLFVAGAGRVGGALLAHMAAASERLAADAGVRLTLAGVANSRAAVIAPDGLDPRGWRGALDEASGSLDEMVQAAIAWRHGHSVFVDCTASEAPVERYDALLRAGVSVVSANKRGFACSGARYRALRQAAAAGGAGLFLEATVGAGLPVLSTLADMWLTGDRIHRIDGVLSGTLSFLTGGLAAGSPLSRALRAAHERGLTEPDPREDLSGRDVARKLVILARVAGFDVEPDAVALEPFLDAERWANLPLAEFWEALPQVDEEFRVRAAAARERGHRLCYLAGVEEGRCRVGLAEIEADHPCAALRGSDNLIAITSERYAETPLVIRGPGAGPAVTAAGVFADILHAVGSGNGDRTPAALYRRREASAGTRAAAPQAAATAAAAAADGVSRGEERDHDGGFR